MRRSRGRGRVAGRRHTAERACRRLRTVNGSHRRRAPCTAGTVTAASDWGGPAERKRARPALAGSWERLFHTDLPARSLLTWRTGDLVHEALRSSRLERAIGVIYRPATERASHYFGANLGNQFDAILHFDETRALEPLDVGAEWRSEDMPETFPFAV